MDIPKAAPTDNTDDLDRVVVISEIESEKFEGLLNHYVSIGYEITHYQPVSVEIGTRKMSYLDVEYTAILQLKHNLPGA